MRAITVLLLAVGVVATAAAQDKPAGPAEPPKPATAAAATPQPAAAGLHPRVKLETSLGDIVLELDAEKAPLTVDNFVQYVEAGYYDGTIFHRVIPDFMIQGGGYTPDLKEKAAGRRTPIRNESGNGLKNQRGTIAMARTAEPHSATSQFYINVADNVAGGQRDLDTPRPGPGGPAAYTVFGRVLEGMDVVDQIKDLETRVSPEAQQIHEQMKKAGRPVREPEKSQPVQPPVVKSAKLISPYDRPAVQKAIAAAEQARAAAEQSAQGELEKRMQEVVKKQEEQTGHKAEKTPSGLYHIRVREGSGAQPKPTDTVEVHYTGWLVDGTKFDSSVDRGQPASFPLNGVIRGWTEGVGRMKVGEKARLIIPPELAYGQAGRPSIPPNSILIFEVELLGIK